MIKEKVEWSFGVKVITKDSSIIFDPTHAELDMKNYRFISHAHSDHTKSLSTGGFKYTTNSTKIIYERIRKKVITGFREVKPNNLIKLDGVEVLPLNAGHMLGSLQFKVTTPNTTLLYTGDLNCVNTLTTNRADCVECDILIIEATFGNPFFIFPDRESIYAKIIEWATNKAKKGFIPTFHVYSAGKAQEIIRLFNVYTKLSVIANSIVSDVNEIYNEEGFNLRYERAELGSDNIYGSEPYVYVTTPSDALISERYIRASATGWALRSVSNLFPSFPLSSHADFKQLTQFVKSTKAKSVYIFTGFCELYSAYLRKRFGIKARPIPIAKQTRLPEFSHASNGRKD